MTTDNSRLIGQSPQAAMAGGQVDPAVRPARGGPGLTRRALRVLVADDSVDMAESLAVLLRLWGHKARATFGGDDAVRDAFLRRPDVLLLDVAMPVVCGLDVAMRLRLEPNFDRTRLVAITGYADEAHHELCRQAGFDGILVKPLDLVALQSMLTTARECLPVARRGVSNTCRPKHSRPRLSAVER